MNLLPAINRRLKTIEQERGSNNEPLSDEDLIGALNRGDHDPRHRDALHRRLSPHLDQNLLVASLHVLHWDRTEVDPVSDFVARGPVSIAVGIISQPRGADPVGEQVSFLRSLEDDPNPHWQPAAIAGGRARAGLMLRCLGSDLGRRIRRQAEDIFLHDTAPKGLLEAPTSEAIHRLCDPLNDLIDLPMLLGRSHTSNPMERAQQRSLKKEQIGPGNAGQRVDMAGQRRTGRILRKPTCGPSA